MNRHLKEMTDMRGLSVIMNKRIKDMERIKKVTAVCLVMMLVFCVSAGCGSKKTSYEVLVTDEAGGPVTGVTIQFCSDTECLLGTTDEKGLAAFEKEAGAYTVHVLKVPEGFAADDTEYKAPAEPGQMTVTLKRQVS
ncbi:MAG TPA: hypothetical protein DCG37_08245 [Lachnospiraceae bacterium]|nr:hypothetical protein [Lachnospiraceae bacterium]